MNGRAYDPLVGRFLSVDAFVQTPDFTQSFNRYSYCLNNPLRYTDPTGEFGITLAIAIGVVVNYAIQAWSGNINSVGDFFLYSAIGGLSGAAGGIAGPILGGFVSTGGFFGASSSGFGAGFAGGFISGFGNGIVQKNNVGQALKNGIIDGALAGVTAGLLNGIIGGIDAVKWGCSFWDGGEKPTVYNAPITNNPPKEGQEGGCALRCFEEFSESYGYKQYDYEYWLDQNRGANGVPPKKVTSLVNGTGVFSSQQIEGTVNDITNAMANNQRVMAAFNTESGGSHAVMVNKAKVWPSGKYKIWFSETNRIRLAPYFTKDLRFDFSPNFFTFYPK